MRAASVLDSVMVDCVQAIGAVFERARYRSRGVVVVGLYDDILVVVSPVEFSLSIPFFPRMKSWPYKKVARNSLNLRKHEEAAEDCARDWPPRARRVDQFPSNRCSRRPA
jgi:hypothetical protein